jgi:hypothetical protein
MLKAGQDWAAEVRSALEVAARRGFVLVLLSKSATESPYVQQEVEHAFGLGSAVVPVIVGNEPGVFVLFPEHVRSMLSRLYHFDLTKRPFDDAMTDLIRMLKELDIE